MISRWHAWRLFLALGLISFCPFGQTRADALPGGSASVAPFHVFLLAKRAADQHLILSVSAPVVLDRVTTARTNLLVPAENTPALPLFTAALTRPNAAGIYELVTRVTVLETTRDKKGKLKRSKRVVGSLLPIRLGETQTASSPDDPLALELRVERR